MTTEPPTVPTAGPRVRAARHAAGLTVDALALRTGLRQPHLTYVEGDRKTINWSTFYRLVVMGGLGLEHFFPADVILGAARRLGARIQAESVKSREGD